MNIHGINHIAFGKIFYLGYSTKTNNVFYFSKDNFTDLKKNSDLLLTDKQKKVTYEIDKQLFPDSFERKLDKDLEAKNTCIVFRYEGDGNISLYLTKLGINSYGKKYGFIPSNKDCTSPIKEVFYTKSTTLKEIQEKTKRFIEDCKTYLNDNNSSNRAIEEDLFDDDDLFC